MNRSSRVSRFALLAIIVGVPTPSRMHAQSAGDFNTATVKELAAPGSPAFVLLGVSPSVIQRSLTPRAVTTSLVSLAKDHEALPRNLAVEIAPFWLTSQPSYTFDDQYAHGGSPASTIQRTFLSTSAFSLGSTPKLQGRDTVGTAFGLGYSVMLWPGRASNRLLQLRDSLVKRLGLCAMQQDVTGCYNSLKPLLDSLESHTEPVGFRIQFAGGGTAQFPHDTIQRGKAKAAGIWLTPSYTIESRVDFIGVVRWLSTRSDSSGVSATRTLDLGGRLLWRPTQRLALSAEGISRQASGGGGSSASTTRFGGVVEVKATSDMFVVYAIGQDFAARNVKQNPLFATLGLHLGLGKKPTVSLQ